jgi:hypothetical protein
MSTVSLLGSAHATEGLETFARKFFTTLGVPATEEKPAGCDFGACHFKGRLGLLHFKVTRAANEHADMPFCIAIHSHALDSDALVDEVQSLLRGVMVPKGFRFARMVAVGRIGEHDSLQ